MELVANWGQGSKTFGPDETITVGRSQQCSIVLDHGSVSRTHLTVSFSNGQWSFVDSSSNGTFADGRKSDSGPITGATVLRVGSIDGPSLSLEPQGVAAPASSTPSPTATGDSPNPAGTVAATPLGDSPNPAGTVAATPVSDVSAQAPAGRQGSGFGNSADSSQLPPASQGTEAFTPGFAAPTPPASPVEPVPRFEPPAAAAPPPAAPTPPRFDPPPAAPNSFGGQASPSVPPISPSAPSPFDPGPSVQSPQPTPPGPPPAGPMGAPPAPQAPMGAMQAGTMAAGSGLGSSLPDHSQNFGGGAGAGTIQLDDRMLRLELDGRTGAFHPNQQVTIGRDPSNDMTSRNQLVSASHCRFTHDGTTWWIEDVGSTRGTYIDGRKVAKKQKIQGAFNVSLGDDDAGDQLRVVTGGYHKRKENKAPLFLAGAALAAVTVIGILAFVLWPDTSGLEETIAASEAATQEEIATAKAEFAAQAAGANGNSPEQLQKARLATGLIFVINNNEEIVGTGSGAVVSDDGLLLTNLHVALPGTYFERTGNPQLQGAEDGPFVIVGFTSTDGGTVDQFFKAEHVAPHPGHDAALLKIVEGFETNENPAPSMDSIPEPLEFATSSTLKGGDQIAVVGYPGLARQDSKTARVSVSINNFQSFTECNVNTGWGCQVDFPQGLLNVAGETLEGGSSGGPIIRNGKVVGIQMGVLSAGDGGASGQDQGVPSDIVLDGFPQIPRPTE